VLCSLMHIRCTFRCTTEFHSAPVIQVNKLYIQTPSARAQTFHRLVISGLGRLLCIALRFCIDYIDCLFLLFLCFLRCLLALIILVSILVNPCLYRSGLFIGCDPSTTS
jgi:hypothetical protein